MLSSVSSIRDLKDRFLPLKRHPRPKQLVHAAHENRTRLLPLQGALEFNFVQLQGPIVHLEAVAHAICVAVGAVIGTSSLQWIPGLARRSVVIEDPAYVGFLHGLTLQVVVRLFISIFMIAGLDHLLTNRSSCLLRLPSVLSLADSSW